MQPDPAFAGPALVVLGAPQEELFPLAVQAALPNISRPADIDWVGTTVWNEAYVAALRGIASARRDARAADSSQSPQRFNTDWNQTYLNVRPVENGGEQPEGNTVLHDMVAGYSAARLARVRRAVELANTMVLTPPEAAPSARWSATGEEDRRAGLQRYVGDALQWFTFSPPRPSEETRLGRLPQIPNSLLVVLPTAVGKTKVTGDWLARQGVGPAEGAPRVLWITDQQKLVDDVLNPDKTLQRCLPEGTRVTSVWEGHKKPEDAAGDVVVITKNSVETELVPEKFVSELPEDIPQRGIIDPADFDLVIFDEADVMLSELKMSVVRRFDKCKKLFLTATPSRGVRKDLQRLMHHVRPVTLLEAAQQEIIAPVRILTIVARDEAHAEQIATYAALHLFVKEGKKGVVYCQPGGGNAQAARVAEAVELHAQGILGESYHPGQQYADMVGSVRNDSRKVISHFETELETGMLTTCGMLQRGWDPRRMDGGIFIGPQPDFTELQQKMGRGFRLEPDNPDKIALIVQIKYGFVEGRTDYTAEMAFGFDQVMSGALIGPGLNLGGTGEGGGSGRSGRSGGGSASDEAKKFIDGLPLELRQPLQPFGRPLSEVIISPRNRHKYERPPGFDTTIDDILVRYPGFRDWWFRDKLAAYVYTDANGNETMGVPSVRVASLLPDQTGTTRYYHTATSEAFLAETDIPKVLLGESYSKAQLGQKLGVPPSLVVVAARETGIVLEEKVKGEASNARAGRAGWRYSAEQAVTIGDWINAIPVAEDTMVWVGELTREYERYARSYFSNNNIPTETRRHPPDSGLNGLGLYVEQADAQAMRAEHGRIKTLMAQTTPFRDIVNASGVARETIREAMTPLERMWYDSPEMIFVEIGGESRRSAHHLPKDVAAGLLERISDNKLQPHEVSRRALSEWMGISESRVRQIMGDVPYGQKRIGPRGSQMAVYHISALRQMAESYRENGRGQTKEKDPAMLARLDAIDFSRLPQPGQPVTAEQQEYARTIQLDELGLPATALGDVRPPRPAAPQAAPEQPPATPPAPAAPLTFIAPASAPAETAPSIPPTPKEAPLAPAAPETSAEPVSAPPAARQQETPPSADPLAATPTATPPAAPPAEKPVKKAAAPKKAPVRAAASPAPAEDAPQPQAAEPPVAAAIAEAPESGPMTFAEIMARTGRSHDAVRNVLAQLGYTDDFANGLLPEDKTLLVIRALSGGKKKPAAAIPPPAVRPQPERRGVVQSMDTPSAIHVKREAEQQPVEDTDPTHWQTVEQVIASLRCTPAALSQLVAGDNHKSGPRLRRNAEDLVEMHTTLVDRLQASARRLRSSSDGWMKNEVLAKQLDMPPEEVPRWMYRQGITIGQGESRVARYVGQKVEYEVIYAERIWRWALGYKQGKR
jgi:superfamily II DNA or RNA helicase